MPESNAIRFINAYNTIDQSIRAIYNFRRNISFADMIRRSVPLNSVVRRYEDKLIDYARLRNAIIHNSTEERVIAEPHDDVVLEMERIADLISTPPMVLQTIPRKDVYVFDGATSLKRAIEITSATGYRAIPVYWEEKLIGVVHNARLVEILGQCISNGGDLTYFCENTPIKDIMKETDIDTTYTIRSEKLTVQEALDIFYNNRKILAIIITKKGNFLERPIGIVTMGDIIDLNKIVDDYSK